MKFKNLWIIQWLCLSGVIAATPIPPLKNANFEKAEGSKWVIRSLEITAHYQGDEVHEGQKALKLVPNPMVEGKYKAQVTQLVPWDTSMKLKPKVMVKGAKLIKASLSIQCFNGLFSESETLPIQELESAEDWQVLGTTEEVEVPEFTKFVEFRVVIESGVEAAVWLDTAQLSASPTPEEESSSKPPASLVQQVALFQDRLQKEQPKLLIVGDASALGYHRFLDKMMEASGESVMAFGFVGEAPVKKIHEYLRDQKVKIPEGSLVALNFGYQALLNEKQPVQELVAALKEFAVWLENQGATVRVVGLFQQHEHVPSHWIELSESFHQALLKDGTFTIIQHATAPREESKEQLMERNHLPNHAARESLTQLLLKALEHLKNPS